MKHSVQFDREKFKEAIWFLASYCPPDELGNVKLHKALYFADMLHYLDEGRPLTGAEYIKQRFGPTARHLSACASELAAEGKIEVRDRFHYGLPKRDYLPRQPFEPQRLSASELALLREIADVVRARSAKEISELSHNAAWETAAMGETLPYFSALALAPGEITDDDRTWALETAKAYAHQKAF
jgi:uncharacterized phage-associated protein